MKKLKKRYLLYAFLLSIMILSFITNPTKSDYLTFSEQQHGFLVTPPGVEIERRNYFLFSTYTSVTALGHYGIVHLGFMGSFFKYQKDNMTNRGGYICSINWSFLKDPYFKSVFLK